MSEQSPLGSIISFIGSLILAGSVGVGRLPPEAPTQAAAAESQPEEKGISLEVFDVLQPVRAVRPVYPRVAKMAGIQGKVSLSVTIGKDGAVADIHVLSGDQHFVKAAVKAVGQWRYSASKDVRVTIVTIFFTRHREDAGPPNLMPLTAVRPLYPPAAKAAGIQGTVTLLATVEKDGSVSKLDVLAGDPLFSQAAIDAVLQWRYARMDKAAATDVFLSFTLPKGDDPENFVTPPMVIYKPEPTYNNTRETKAAKLQGVVQLDVVVTTDGTVSDVKVVKSLDKILDENAVQTVKTWKFLPALKAGKPVAFKTSVAISFRLF